MTNQVTEEQKSNLTKVLAILGFIAIIILLVWFAVKLVSNAPNAFFSLASIADSVYNFNSSEDSLNVETEKNVVNAGEAFTISWEKVRTAGTYTFSYTCTEGISIELRDENGAIRALSCDTPLVVNDTESLNLRVASEKNRFTDIAYILTFTPDSQSREEVQEVNSLTVVNATLPTLSETDEVALEEDADDTITDEPATGVVAGETVTTPPPVTVPTYTEEIIYEIPTSDPNGTIDLQVTFVGVGVEQNNTFVPAGTIEVGQKGAIRFEVKNIGSKTSEDWDFVANLPSDITYRSDTLKPLKPNERAVFTLGFTGISETGTESFSVTVNAENDLQKRNNSFVWAVTIVE
jgi:hypothetical protein